MRALSFIAFSLACLVLVTRPSSATTQGAIGTFDSKTPQQGLKWNNNAVLTTSGGLRVTSITTGRLYATTATIGTLITTTVTAPLAHSVTAGTGLTGGVYNGSANRTFAVDSSYIRGLFSIAAPLTYNSSTGVFGANTILTTFGALANSAGFLNNNGSGVLSWATPTDTGITQLTGEVTAGPGSGSQVATIANSVVTNAKMVNMANNTIKSNISGGSAAPSDNGLSAIIDAIFGGANGDFIQRISGTWDDSVYTFPTTAPTTGKIFISDGTNMVGSTPAYPNASATAGKVIRSDGTNYAASTFTIPDTYAQGDTIYASAASVFSALAKDTNATRYLSNQGTSNNPSWNQVNLANGVTGDLPFANLSQITGLSLLGVTGTSTADVAAITGTANQVARVDSGGTALAFGAVNLASSAAVTGDLPFANLTQGSALSVLGVTGNAIADVASIAAATDGNVLRRSGTAIAFGPIDLASAGATAGSVLPVASGGTNLSGFSTGDLFDATGPSVMARLPFVATATRYLANTGTAATLPAWDQVNLTNGVTGTLPAGNGGSGVPGSWSASNDAGMTLYYPLTQSPPLNYVGGFETLTVTGSPTLGQVTDGATLPRTSIGNCLTFSGTGQYLAASPTSLYNVTTGDFTLLAWVKTTAAATQYAMNKQQSSGTFAGYGMGLSSAGLPVLSMRDATPTDVSGTIGSTAVNDGFWHLEVISVVRSGNATGYVDGVNVGTRVVSTASASLTNTSAFYIGAANAANLFNGSIDEAMVFNYALTASQIRAYYLGSSQFIPQSAIPYLGFVNAFTGANTHAGVEAFNNDTTIKPGTASATAAIGGTLTVNTTAVGNIGGGEDNLMTYSVPANTLATNGDTLHFHVSGSLASAGTHVKEVIVYFGATKIVDSGALAVGTFDWEAEGDITRTGAATQIATARFNYGATLVAVTVSVPGETLSGAVTFKCTGTVTGVASDNDIIQKFEIVEWKSIGS